MNKPEYSDLYKFMVSLGVILLSFAILLPWLFLREPFDGLVTASQITELTSTAQTLVISRQTTGLWLIRNIVWISSIPAVIGCLALGGGLYLWQRKQKNIDQKDELELEKLRLEVQNMSPEQIALKVVRETEEQVQDRSIEESQPTETVEKINIINKYFEIERGLVEKLNVCFGAPNVRSNQQIGDNQIDMIVRIGSYERLFIEVKYITNPSNLRTSLQKTADMLDVVVSKYNSLRVKNIGIGIGLVIIAQNSLNSFSEHTIGASTANFVKGKQSKLKMLVLNESEFIRLDCSALRAMLITD